MSALATVRRAASDDEAENRAATGDVEAVMIGAWSLVHGFATLWLTGNIPTELGPPDDLARRIASVLDASA